MKNKRLRYALIVITVLVAGLLLVDILGSTPFQTAAIPETSQSSTDSPEASPVPTQDIFYEQRMNMVDLTIESRDVSDPDVLHAMRTVPRHQFVTDEYKNKSYADNPLPIGYGQTISQPYIVALMTELLDLKPGEKVLEIGTGSGYQAAVLAELGKVEVYSIEIIPELAERAARTLHESGYTDVHLKQDDGYYGWEEFAPFDAIIVTAAPDHLPLLLAQQLSEGGRLVIPIGPVGGFQTLWKFVLEGGEMRSYNMGGVRFVPFTRE